MPTTVIYLNENIILFCKLRVTNKNYLDKIHHSIQKNHISKMKLCQLLPSVHQII